MERRGRGFTLIELLIVIAVIGVIAAIAIPSLYNALQRSRQKRTMGDLRSVATACESYQLDNNQYFPSSDAALSTIRTTLEPTYVTKLPRLDGWNSDIRYEASATEYTLTSWGRDKAPGGGGDVLPSGATTDFRNDIVLATGGFVQFPDGVQD